MGWVIDNPCCCGGPCCNCAWDPVLFQCNNPGPVPTTLTISVTTGCGTFSGTLTWQGGAANCWTGTVTLHCVTIDPLNPGITDCQGPFTTNWTLCCGSAAQSTPTWRLYLSCANQFGQNAAEVGNITETSCSPLLIHFPPFSSGIGCINCTADTFDVVITQ